MLWYRQPVVKGQTGTIRALTISLLVALEDGRSVSEPQPSPFFREILANFVTIQSWRTQNGIFMKKPDGLVPYDGLILGWYLGQFSRKNIPKQGKNHPKTDSTVLAQYQYLQQFQAIWDYFRNPVTRLSRRQQGFKSPWGRQNKNKGLQVIVSLFYCLEFDATSHYPHNKRV